MFGTLSFQYLCAMDIIDLRIMVILVHYLSLQLVLDVVCCIYPPIRYTLLYSLSAAIIISLKLSTDLYTSIVINVFITSYCFNLKLLKFLLLFLLNNGRNTNTLINIYITIAKNDCLKQATIDLAIELSSI